MSQNVNYGAPSAQAQGSFTPPANSNTETKTKLPIDLFPQGLHMATIFAVVGLGTHMESYGTEEATAKNKIFIWFELPQFKAKIYQEDENVRSLSMMDEMVFSVYKKANLRKILEAACQRALTDEEADAFDITKLLGTTIMLNIQHYQKKDKSFGQKIEGYASIVGMPAPMGYQPENEKILFYLDQGLNNFRTEMFAKLPGFLKKKLINSQEGQQFAASGGIFAKLEQSQNNANSPATATQQSAPVPAVNQGTMRVQMLVNDFTYEQYLQSDWTDESLVANGKAKWIQTAPSPAPAPVANTPAPAPSAPVQNVSTPASPTPQQNIPSAAPVQQGAQAQNTPAQNWLEEEDDDMPF